MDIHVLISIIGYPLLVFIFLILPWILLYKFFKRRK